MHVQTSKRQLSRIFIGRNPSSYTHELQKLRNFRMESWSLRGLRFMRRVFSSFAYLCAIWAAFAQQKYLRFSIPEKRLRL